MLIFFASSTHLSKPLPALPLLGQEPCAAARVKRDMQSLHTAAPNSSELFPFFLPPPSLLYRWAILSAITWQNHIQFFTDASQKYLWNPSCRTPDRVHLSAVGIRRSPEMGQTHLLADAPQYILGINIQASCFHSYYPTTSLPGTQLIIHQIIDTSRVGKARAFQFCISYKQRASIT